MGRREHDGKAQSNAWSVSCGSETSPCVVLHEQRDVWFVCLNKGGKLLAVGNNFMKCSFKWQLLSARILSRIPKEFGVHRNIKNIQFSLLTIIRILEKLFNFVHYIAYDLATGFQILIYCLSHKLTLNPGRCFLFKSLINGHFSRSVVSFLSSVATSGCGRKPRPQLPTWLVAQVRKGAAGQVMEAELFYQQHRKTESFYVKKKEWSHWRGGWGRARLLLWYCHLREQRPSVSLRKGKKTLPLSPKLIHLFKFSHSILFCCQSTYISPWGRIKDRNTPQITLEYASNNKGTEKEQGQIVPWRQGWLKLEMSETKKCWSFVTSFCLNLGKIKRKYEKCIL